MLLAVSNSVRYSSISVTHVSILVEAHLERWNPEGVRSAPSGKVHDSSCELQKAKLNKSGPDNPFCLPRDHCILGKQSFYIVRFYTVAGFSYRSQLKAASTHYLSGQDSALDIILV